jgi:opacity protein-like surface antigen
MGTFEARKNKFMLITDLMYLSLEKTKDTTGPLFSALTAQSKTFMLSPVVGYRLAEKPGASLDAIVGIRFWHTSTRLELAPRLLAGRVREGSKNWADVIAGLRGQAHLTRIFSLIGRGDFGGGGSDFTYQLFGGVGIDVSKSASLFLGYRYLDIKYTREDFLFDGAFKGPVLGAAFRF